MKPTIRKFLVTGLIILAAAVLLLVPIRTVDVTSQADRHFQLDVAMPRVRKILVRSNAVKKIVAMADATLLDQQWQNMAFESAGPLLKGDWHVTGEGRLSIDVNDDYLGKQSIKLNQSVDIKPDRLISTNKLIEPSKSIREYSSSLRLTPGVDGNAEFDLSLKIRVRTTAGLITRGIVQREIEAAAAKSLNQQETVIRELVAQQRNKLLIIPNFGRE